MLSLLASQVALSSCSADNAKSRYLLAERLWAEGKYAASVLEFEKVVTKDPNGDLGLKALFRAGMTQAIYLNQHQEAVRKFQAFIENSQDPEAIWEAQKQVGDILFTKLEQHDQVILHYQDMLRKRPKTAEAPEFWFRVGRSYFFLWQFDEAKTVFERLIKNYKKSSWAEEAMYQIGVVSFTRAGRDESRFASNEAFEDSIRAFEKFLRKYPNSARASEAIFGIANCLEELDQLDEAVEKYRAIATTYPSPKVIELKLERIRERQAQRSR